MDWSATKTATRAALWHERATTLNGNCHGTPPRSQSSRTQSRTLDPRNHEKELASFLPLTTLGVTVGGTTAQQTSRHGEAFSRT